LTPKSPYFRVVQDHDGKQVFSVNATNRRPPRQNRKNPLVRRDLADSPFSVCPLMLQFRAVRYFGPILDKADVKGANLSQTKRNGGG
jgi:hypothetical protein